MFEVTLIRQKGFFLWKSAVKQVIPITRYADFTKLLIFSDMNAELSQDRQNVLLTFGVLGRYTVDIATHDLQDYCRNVNTNNKTVMVHILCINFFLMGIDTPDQEESTCAMM
jgi:hypothetical protein